MGSVIETFKERCTTRQTTLVFPEGEDERILGAASALVEDGLASPVILGDPDVIRTVADQHQVSLEDLEVIDPKTDEARGPYATEYTRVRPVSEETAMKIVGNELVFAALAVRTGDADAMIGGCVRTSGELISAAEEVIGLRPDVSVPSSFFIMELADGDVLFFADSALNENPTAEELADVAVTTGENAATLMEWQSRVALLSFSTKGSADHPDVEKVRKATELAAERAGDCHVDGELQADAALDEDTAARKLGDLGQVAGRANTLIFPDLDAGNIGYKLTQELGGASAFGPILQGFTEPISDLSRGASVEDIVGVAAITASLATGEEHP